MTHTVRSIDSLINNIPEAQPIIPANAANKKVDVKDTNSHQNTAKSDDVEANIAEKPAKSSEIDSKIQQNSSTSPKIQENSQTSPKIQENDDKIAENAASTE
jgi:hypothetical protein